MKKKKYRVIYKYSDIHPEKKKSSYLKYYKAYYIKHKIEIRIKQNIYYKGYYENNKDIILSKRREKLKQKEKLEAQMKKLKRIHFLKKKYFKKWYKSVFAERDKKRGEMFILRFD